MTEQTTSEAARVDKGEDPTLKRSIQMKWFADADDKRKVIGDNKPLTLGQLVGQVFDVKEKVGTLPDGSSKTSLLAIGEFEAVNYKSGEVIQSTACYLPGYFAETFKSALDKGSTAIVFAVEIVLTPTGKNIPISYEVRNLATREPENPINAMKAQLAAAGRLRLPPPPSRAVGLIGGPAGELDGPDEDEGQEAPPPATGRKAKAEAATA